MATPPRASCPSGAGRTGRGGTRESARQPEHTRRVTLNAMSTQEITEASGYWFPDDDATQRGVAVLNALRRYRAAETAMRRRTRDSMGMGETDLLAVRFLLQAQRSGTAGEPEGPRRVPEDLVGVDDDPHRPPGQEQPRPPRPAPHRPPCARHHPDDRDRRRGPRHARRDAPPDDVDRRGTLRSTRPAPSPSSSSRCATPSTRSTPRRRTDAAPRRTTPGDAASPRTVKACTAAPRRPEGSHRRERSHNHARIGQDGQEPPGGPRGPHRPAPPGQAGPLEHPRHELPRPAPAARRDRRRGS